MAGTAAGTAVDVTAAASRYRAELPIPPTSEDRAAGRTDPTLARGRTDRLRVGVDATRALARGSLRFGGAVDRMGVEYGTRRLRGSAQPASNAAAAGVVAGGYLDLTMPASGSVDLRMGVRADHFSSDAGLRWAPRLAVHWSLSDDVLLTLATGRYHQYTRGSDEQVEGALADVASGLTPTAVGTAALFPVATADHLVLALDQQLTPGVRIGVQGFLKGFSGMSSPAPDMTSSGLDLRVLRQGADLTGWLGYSLVWFWSTDRQTGASISEFTGRHLLTAGVTGPVAGPIGMDLRIAFSDGLPYTSVALASDGAPERTSPLSTTLDAEQFGSGQPALAGGPTGSFLRIDAELHAYLRPGLRAYVKVLNALDRRNALFWYFAPWRDPDVRPLAELSLLPIVGLEWRF